MPDSTPPAAVVVPPVIGTLPDGTPIRLRLHAELLTVPSWETDEEFTVLCESIDAEGVITPLLVVLSGEMDTESGAEWADVFDGRHRFEAFLRVGAAGRHPLPCVETDRPIREIMIRTLVERRHASKGARAYLVWPLVAPQIPARGRSKKEIPTESVITLPTLAARYGFSPDLFDQARRLHEIFTTRKDLKADLEEGILSGDIGLGAALAGIAGKEATVGTSREDAPHLQLLQRGFKALTARFAPAKWDQMPTPDRTAAESAAVECVLAWPDDVRKRLKKAL